MAAIDKGEVERLLKIPGEARGAVFKTDADFIRDEKGEDALDQLESALNEAGCPINYEKLLSMNFYPIGYRPISLIAVRDTFGFDDEKIKEMGRSAPKTSLTTRLFAEYFLSFDRMIEELSKFWKEHYTVGELSAVKADEKNKVLVLKLEGVDLDPIFCTYLTGYMSELLSIVTKSKASCEETKCTFRGDNHHEYSFKW